MLFNIDNNTLLFVSFLGLNILYFSAFFKIFYINPDFLNLYSTCIQTFVALFLIYNFHPYTEHRITKFNVNVIFAAAVFLLTNVVSIHIANLIDKSNIKVSFTQMYNSIVEKML
jgi:hypothetical protein